MTQDEREIAEVITFYLERGWKWADVVAFTCWKQGGYPIQYATRPNVGRPRTKGYGRWKMKN